LYGTTIYGGAAKGGTIFRTAPSGDLRVIDGSKGAPDGEGPFAGLVALNGAVYGTTEYGGTSDEGLGTVFKVTPAGKKTILHNFARGSDGANPRAGLLNVNGTLYGTTYAGGASNNGTVFKMTPAGKETVIYSFKGGPAGGGPMAGLIDVGGTLYGTTQGHTQGLGTVFKITTSGVETRAP
jgi:uncharacterized repeat protein (TIGR03803 family)